MKVTEITFGNKLKSEVLGCEPQDFVNEVAAVSCRLMINPHCLMVVMDLETAGTFDPAITNKLGYTGLIQFGKTAAAELGTTTAALRKLNALQQLAYVEKYLQRYRKRMKTLTDVYLAVFFPAAIGRQEGWVLQTSRLSPARIAKWNPLFDVNKDQQIQVWEIKTKILSRVPADKLIYVN